MPKIYIYTHVCSRSGRDAKAETQMRLLKHTLLLLLVKGFEITQNGVVPPKATEGHSLSIQVSFIKRNPTVQSIPDSSPLSEVQLQTVFVALNYCFLFISAAKLHLENNK